MFCIEMIRFAFRNNRIIDILRSRGKHIRQIDHESYNKSIEKLKHILQDKELLDEA